jgi:Tol biopolymer transport system component
MNVIAGKIFLLISLLFVMSCGGGGGGNPQDNNNNGGYNNEKLSGYLFPQDYGDTAYLIDVKTGAAITIPNTNWESQDDIFPRGVSQFRKKAVQNNHSIFIVNVLYCKKENADILSRDISCIYWQDFDGNYVGGLELLYDVGEVQLSEDKQYYALYRNFASGSPDKEWLEIYTSNGQLLSDRKLDNRRIQWFRNGGLLYANGPHFVFTKPYSTDTDYSLTLPDSISNGGWIDDFDISNDQTQIVFTVGTQSTAFTSTEAKAYIMNLDGTNIRLLADVPERPAFIANPAWSPDGKWILLEEGYVSGQDRDTIGTAGNLFVVPSENLGKVFMLTMDDSKRSQEVILLYHDHDGPGAGTALSTKSTGENYEWIP